MQNYIGLLQVTLNSFSTFDYLHWLDDVNETETSIKIKSNQIAKQRR